MLRFLNSLPQQYREYKALATADDGVTVPEYMLVLGFVSIAIVVAFQIGPVSTAVGNLATNLAAKITPDA